MTRPRLLDLFCGAGGAAMGYHRAGFDVVGVDIRPQPRYPFEFCQHDAMELLGDVADYGEDVLHDSFEHVDAIHASPPCQRFTQMSNRWRGSGGKADGHLDLLTPTLARIRPLKIPYVVENVPGAKRMMRATLALHGGMFGLGVYRPRLFESNVLVLAAPEPAPRDTIGIYGKAPDGRLLWARADGTEQHAPASLAEASEAMGIDWMTWDEIRESIPPAYTEHIGGQLLEHLRERAA
jgi:DNA (cytosine-5)-methyltransferase 1